jgi:hypothetical protein
MTAIAFALLAAALGAGPTAAPAGAPDAALLLRDSDRSRGALPQGITWTVELESQEEGTKKSKTMIVKARGVDALAETIAPPRNKGELVLFNDRALWFLKPGLRRPVSISARQRFQGDASNGDIASTNYARDYTGTVVGEDEVGGEPAWRLDLVAKASDVTYDKIRYWVSKRRHLALKAEFLTVGGDLFKTATFDYGNRLRVGGETWDFVSRMTIKDAMGTGSVTTLSFSSPRPEAHAASLFNINNVVR